MFLNSIASINTHFKIKAIDSIISLEFSHDAISWIHIQNDGTILDWNFTELDRNLIYNPDFNISYEYVSAKYSFY